MLRSFRLAPLALLILVPLLAACSRSRPEAQAKGSTNSIALTGAGATFPSVLYNRWLVVYHDHNPKVAITYAAVGSGEGVRRFLLGKRLLMEKKSILAPAMPPCRTRRLPTLITMC